MKHNLQTDSNGVSRCLNDGCTLVLGLSQTTLSPCPITASVPFSMRAIEKAPAPESFGVITDADERCACCNDEITRPEGDPWEGRLDHYCYDCALCRCDATPGSCGKRIGSAMTWGKLVAQQLAAMSRQIALQPKWLEGSIDYGHLDTEEVFTGQENIDDSKHNKLFGLINWSAGPGIDRTQRGNNWFAWINRFGMGLGYRRVELFISFPNQDDGRFS